MATGDEAVTVEQVARALGVLAPAPPLPSGYTRLEYIESTGTQYIDTGFKPDQGSRCVVDFTPSANGFMAACETGWAVNSFDIHSYAAAYGTQYDFFGADGKLGQRRTADLNGNFFADTLGKSKTFTSATFSSGLNLWLFTSNRNGKATESVSAMLYSCQIYSGTLMQRNYVPARRDSDGAVGMYDTVSGQFFGNSGTGAFKAGPEVATSHVDGAEGAAVTLKQFKVASSKLGGGGEQPPAPPLPSGYTQLEYIEGTGTQYIDTGYFPCELTRVVTAITPTSGNTTNGVFGGRTGNNVSTFSLWCVNGVFRTDFDTNNQYLTTDVRVETGVRVEVDKDRGTTRLGSKTFTQTGRGFRAANSMHVFAVNSDEQAPRYFRGRIEVFTIYESGLLEHELVPARRASDGAVGMYDTVAGAFLANSGTGAFKAGPEVAYDQPPAGLKETVIYEGDESGRLYLQRELTAIRKVVVEYRLQINLSQLYTFTYEGEPTGNHVSSDDRVRITFSVVGESQTLVVEDVTGALLVRFERVTIYEQQ